MFYLYLLIGMIVLGIIIGVLQNSAKKRQKNTLLERIKNKEGFNPDYTLFSHYYDNLLALDKTGNQILLCELLDDGGIKEKLINFNDIFEAEIKTNNNTISKISLGGTIAGGVLAGGVGALIGSQSNKKTVDKIKTITLKINTKDFDNPIINFNLFESIDKKGDNPDGDKVKETLKNAEKWEGMLKIILEENKLTH